MPAITPSYLYTFFAILVVGSILTLTFMNYAESVMVSVDVKELRGVINNVAAKIAELVNIVEGGNIAARAIIQVPASSNGKQYWLRLTSEQCKVWVEGYFGESPLRSPCLRTCIPVNASASGQYFGGYGAIILECCRFNGQIIVTISFTGG
ncbi:MAG: hypothetical protein QXT06_01095 [Candidatus Bathyarchaeia archaeon]